MDDQKASGLAFEEYKVGRGKVNYSVKLDAPGMVNKGVVIST